MNLATKERRIHDRVEVKDHAVFVEHKSGIDLRVGNLGYSGMLLAGALPGGELPGGEISGTLKVLDMTVPATGHVVRASTEGLGVLFDHSSGELLQALRLVLDPARYGMTMVAMNKNYVPNEYRGPDWLVFQGLGPTCLAARYASPAHLQVTEFSLTIKPGGFQVVEYRDGEMTTGVKREGQAAHNVAVYDHVNAEQKRTLRRAAGVLFGMVGAGFGAQVVPLLDVIGALMSPRT